MQITINPDFGRVSVVSTTKGGNASTPSALVPIHVVARQFGINASTLRYYEKRGLVISASRAEGRRWYGPVEIRRLAIVLFWQRSALMSLDVISDLLDGASGGEPWQDVVSRHIEELNARIAQMITVEKFISQALRCEYHDRLDDCPDYDELIWQGLEMEPLVPHDLFQTPLHPGVKKSATST